MKTGRIKRPFFCAARGLQTRAELYHKSPAMSSFFSKKVAQKNQYFSRNFCAICTNSNLARPSSRPTTYYMAPPFRPSGRSPTLIHRPSRSRAILPTAAYATFRQTENQEFLKRRRLTFIKYYDIILKKGFRKTRKPITLIFIKYYDIIKRENIYIF